MKEKHPKVDVETVPCEVCRREVPRDEAMSPEGRDYVIFLCGLDCYESWQTQLRQQER